MTEHTYSALSLLREVQERIELALQKEDDGWKPEPIERYGGHKLGVATPEQRAIYRLLIQLNSQHSQIHQETGLPFGTLEGLDNEHQKLHIMMQILKQALMADLVFTFPEVYMRPFHIDADWSVLVYEVDMVAIRIF